MSMGSLRGSACRRRPRRGRVLGYAHGGPTCRNDDDPVLDLAHLRFFGVLPRIALSYLVTAAIVLCTPPRGQVGVLVGLLLGYWALMTMVPVPGVGRGVLEPDLNLSNWLDLHVIGTNHLHHDTRTRDARGHSEHAGGDRHGPVRRAGGTLDPAGAPHLVEGGRAPRRVAGGAAVVGGSVLDDAFPINKSLWTGSYVLFSAGLACLVLALMYWLVDIEGHRGWAGPFLVFGTNAIVADWPSSLLAIVLEWIVVAGPAGGDPLVLREYLYETLFASWLWPAGASVTYAFTYVLLWLGLLEPSLRAPESFIRILRRL